MATALRRSAHAIPSPLPLPPTVRPAENNFQARLLSFEKEQTIVKTVLSALDRPQIAAISPHSQSGLELPFLSCDVILQEVKEKILSLTGLINIAATAHDVACASPVLLDFNEKIKAAKFPIDRLPSYVRHHPDFVSAVTAAAFTRKRSRAFARMVRKCLRTNLHNSQIHVKAVVEVMSTAASMLLYLSRITEILLITTIDKPLPAVPEVIPEDLTPVPEAIPEQGITPSPSANESHGVRDWAKTTFSQNRTGLLNSDSKSSKYPKSLSRLVVPSLKSLASSLTLRSAFHASEPALESKTAPAVGQRRNPDVPYRLRISAVYYLPDPDNPAVDVEMPPITGPEVMITLNSEGKIKTASLPALIRRLTSMEALQDPATVFTFFFTFRYFMCPVKLVDLLRARYNQKPPKNLHEKQMQVWNRTHYDVQLRVLALIRNWFAMYWRHEEDKIALPALLEFIYEDALTLVHSTLNKPPSVLSQLVQDLTNLMTSRDNVREGFVSRQVEKIRHEIRQPTLEPTGFRLPPDADFSVKIFWDSESGAKELARQLTAKVCALCRDINAEELVRSYLLQDESSEARRQHRRLADFGQSLHLFVVSSILQRVPKHAKNITDCSGRVELNERVKVFELWVRVAGACQEQRDFSTAYFIYSGLTASPTSRLKHSILPVSRVCKEVYQKLTKLFDPSLNYKSYNEELERARISNKTFVLLMHPMLRDLETSSILRSDKPDDNLDPDGDGMVVNMTKFRIVGNAVNDMEAAHLPFEFQSECTATIEKWIDLFISKYDPAQEGKLMDFFYDLSYRLERRDSSAPQDPWQVPPKPESQLEQPG